MRNILEQIVDTKRDELQVSQRARPIAALQQMPLYHSPGPSAVERARTGNATGIIAEFKRRSPSKGWIHEQADPVQVTTGYAKGGAAAISVLTDEQYFGGALHDLLAVRQAVDVPLLRKDFTINAYQLHEARAYGANIILLIAAILSPSQVQEFAEEAHSIGLEVLLELHGEEELEHICPAVEMVGINNRNLKNFEVNIDHSIRMVKQLPSHT
ncbi:MAG TPA: indole-3-glycerol phosphate synthase TrpC, partial [Phnomibacter sp.]|nr:indole-3-glycerol phosphate synthase TrpC [Phnomibacter sp.]